MEKKKILIVSRSFYPAIAPRSFRATELAKEFSRQGHDVTVLTHAKGFDYSSFSKEYNLKVVDFVGNKWRDIKANGGGLYATLLKTIRSILKYLLLFPDVQLSWLLKNHLKNYQDFDILISIAVPYPIHFGVALARDKNKNLCKLWVADCGDPFTGNKERRIAMPFYFKLIETWFCAKPDFITVPIDEAINAYPPGCRSKIKTIPQGFNFEETSITKEHIPNKIPHFAYAGALTEGIRDPRAFLNQLTLIKHDFKFFIYTQNQKLLEPFSEKLKNKLMIHGYIPRNQLLQELSSMDFLINFENKTNRQSPSKLIDYAIAGRPVLNVSSRGAKFETLNSFLHGDYRNRSQFKDLDQFRIERIADKFLNLQMEI